MAGSLNRAQLIGHLGADPEIRRTQDGRPIASFSLATSETWKDRTTSERREATEWHRVVIFNEALCKVVEQYLKKGAKIFLEGQIKTRKWQDQAGQDRYSTEIVLQAFDARLVMLDRAERSGYQPGGNGAGDYGYDEGRAAGGTQNRNDAAGATAGQSTRSSASSASAPSFSRDMDDDIPF